MMAVTLEKFVDILIKNKLVPGEDRPLYIYGLQQGFMFLINILTILLIGVLYGKIMESIIFLLVYMPLRSYAGGYHATTPLRCYILSTLMMATVLWTIGLPIWNSMSIGISVLLAVVVIGLLAPVADCNKPLSTNEIRVYKKVTYYIVSILLVLILVFEIIEKRYIAVSITVSICTVASILVLGKLKNYK